LQHAVPPNEHVGHFEATHEPLPLPALPPLRPPELVPEPPELVPEPPELV
jgi:hypothetical protein